MLMRLSENSLTSSVKNNKIIKDGTLEYSLWGGRWVLFCTVCLKPVHANVSHCARHLSATSSRGHETLKKRAYNSLLLLPLNLVRLKGPLSFNSFKLSKFIIIIKLFMTNNKFSLQQQPQEHSNHY